MNLAGSYSFPDAVEKLNSRPVQFLAVDDAIKNANSRKCPERADEIGEFFEVRHIYEERTGNTNGIVVTLWATQRFKSLEPAYRDATILIFKSLPSEPTDKKFVYDYIGPEAYQELVYINDRIFAHEDDLIKNRMIACFGDSNKAGLFKTDLKPGELPPKLIKLTRLKPLDTVGDLFNFTTGAALEDIRKDKAWERRANIYYDYTKPNGLTQMQLAEKYKLDQAQVSKAVKSVRGKLSELAGSEYEAFKAASYRKQGLDVRADGRTGMPDLVIKEKDGSHRVISLKCLDFDRSFKLPIEELTPEIHKARELRTRITLIVYNLSTRKEQEITVDPDRLSPFVQIEP